jgi:hypothetical protein
MSVEIVTTINTLDATFPAATDPRSEGDDHIRNIKSAIKTTFPGVTGAVTATHTELNGAATHPARTDNPHSTTKAQVGLSNADNTSDLNKPISTATQTALDAKLDITGIKTVNGASLVGSGDVVVGSGISISDGATALTSVWSSTKTSTELATKQTTLVSGSNIKTIGGASLLGSGDIALSSAITPLAVVTGTDVATIDITGLDTWGATYDRIVVMGWVYAKTDANGAIYSRMQVGGIWAGSNYQYFREVGTTGAASLTFTNSTSTTFIPITEGAGALDRWKANLSMTIFRTPDNKTLEWSVVSETVTAALATGRVRGMADRSGVAGTFQGVRLYAASGNVSGVLRVYGIKNS